MQYTALIFDCDGTLTHSMPSHYTSWKVTMESHGISFSEELFYDLAGVPSNKIVERLAREHGLVIDHDAVAEAKEEVFLNALSELTSIEPVVSIARRYHGVIPLGVASGGTRKVVMAQLEQLDILQLFEVVVTAEDTERHKPEPDVFLETARQLGVKPQGCCVYEDSDLGIEAARRAGMEWVDIRELLNSRDATG